jgi:hypothetical protein
MIARVRLGLVGLLLVAVAGCGANVAPVSGRVTLDKKPLANARVVFQPASTDKEPGPGSVGMTDAEGKYSLQLMTGNGQGALVGKHKVSITAYNEIADEGKPAHQKGFGTPLVGPEYNAQTKLTFDVARGGNTNANFDLPSAPPEE